MKILIDAHLSENALTGIGRYLNGLLTVLPEIDCESDYHVIVRNDLNPDHPLSLLKSTNVIKIPVEMRGVEPVNHFALSKLISRIKPDIYHHPHFDLPLFQRSESVITIHDLKYIRNPAFFPEFSQSKRIYMKFIMKNAVARAKKVIAASENTMNDLIDLFNTPAWKIDVVYHGLESRFDDCASSDQKNFLKEKFGVHEKYILFVGERRPHKNLTALIDAFKIVKNNLHDTLKLIIIGKSYANYDAPEKQVRELNLEEFVLFADSVMDEELTQFYKNAELLVLPSFYEGFGFPLIEAMSCRTPVIAADNTSMPEVIGRAGLLINPHSAADIADKVLSLLTDEQLKEEMIRKGLDNIKKFTWKKTAENTINVYNQIYERNIS